MAELMAASCEVWCKFGEKGYLAGIPVPRHITQDRSVQLASQERQLQSLVVTLQLWACRPRADEILGAPEQIPALLTAAIPDAFILGLLFYLGKNAASCE